MSITDPMAKKIIDTHGYLLAELHTPFIAKNSKHHDAAETSYNDEMKKHTIRSRLFAIIGKNLNNRLAIYKW